MAQKLANGVAQDGVFSEEQPITALLERWRAGDRNAQSTLVDAVYPYMRNLAKANLRRLGAGFVQCTELAHEAFIRLNSQQSLDWQSRAHFLAVIASVTRNVMIDMVREQYACKRGGHEQHVDLYSLENIEPAQSGSEVFDWIALDQALKVLAELDPVCGKIAEAKLFSAMSIEELAEAFGTSASSVSRHWRFGKSWLVRELDLKLSEFCD